ncbi:MAG: hypothetical protein ACK5C4_10155, partial [Pseudanabaena sp.]
KTLFLKRPPLVDLKKTDFGVSSAKGAGNTKIGFLKVHHWRTFKKPIFIMRIAEGVTIAVVTGVRTNQNKKMKGGAKRRHSSSWVLCPHTLGDSILQKN